MLNDKYSIVELTEGEYVAGEILIADGFLKVLFSIDAGMPPNCEKSYPLSRILSITACTQGMAEEWYGMTRDDFYHDAFGALLLPSPHDEKARNFAEDAAEFMSRPVPEPPVAPRNEEAGT